LNYAEIARLTRAARQAPDLAEAQLAAARQLLENRLAAEALPFIERASELAPTPELAALAGSVAVTVGDLPRAVRHFKLQLAREPEAPEPHANLGLIAAAREEWDLAARHLREAVRLGGTTAEWYNDLGVALFRGGHADEAQAALVEALRLAPGHRDAAANLADVHVAAGRTTEAFFVVTDALRYQPGEADLKARRQQLWNLLPEDFRAGWQEPPLHPSVYDSEYFENHLGTAENTAHWQKYRGRKLDARFVPIVQMARLGPDDEALDLGCGRGELAYHLAGVARRVVAIDYSEAAVAIARSVCAPRDNVEVLQGDAKEIDYKGRFALVVLTDVVEHLHAWELDIVLHRCRQALVPGGQLVIHTPVEGEVRLGTKDDLHTEVVPRERFDFPVHLNLMTLQTLREAVAKAGFEVDQVRFDGKIILSASSPGAALTVGPPGPGLSRRSEAGVGSRTVVLFASNDAFLGDIRRRLEQHHRVRIFAGGSRAQMERELAAADLAWFEWCDDFLIAATELPKACPIVCRLHSYEAFTDHPERVDWSKVDAIVFVNQSVRDLVADRIPATVRTLVIPNGVDFARYALPERKVYGKKVAFAGYLNFKKNPGFLLACFEALYRLDPEFTFHIAGRYQGAHIQVFLEHMLPRLPFRVHFDGWVDDMPGWLSDKDYIISTSYFESFHYSVAEGIAMGLLPLVYDWRGSENCYPADVRFRTLEELTKLVQRYRSEPDLPALARSHRQRLEEHFALELQLGDTERLVQELMAPSAAPRVNRASLPADGYDPKTYWENRLSRHYDLSGVGHLDLGETYNRYMYRLRRWRLERRLPALGISVCGKRVLDVGAGTGYFMGFWKEGGPARLEAVDITDTAVARLAERFPEAEVHKLDISAPGARIPGTFDLVSAFDVLFHIVDDDGFVRALEFIARHLAPGGHAVLGVGYTAAQTPQSNAHYRARTERVYRTQFDRLGLQVVAAEPLFVTMNAPLDPTRVQDPDLRALYEELWHATEDLFARHPLAPHDAERVARLSFLHEQVHLACDAPSASSKLVIVRKSAHDT
jgi:2-polyprenyl-3-methyl-5-hydroxy-6-metoxy-1,4-benzoquinol methylase/Tfp pilus assembly protein PilF